MVQMKDGYVFLNLYMAKRVYIPHGSDESFSSCYYLLNLKMVYIPHGSDERKGDNARSNNL